MSYLLMKRNDTFQRPYLTSAIHANETDQKEVSKCGVLLMEEMDTYVISTFIVEKLQVPSSMA